MSKVRVGVFMGGRGNEKEVSFNSGRTVCDHLDAFRYDIIPIFQRSNGSLYILPWRFLHRGKISDFEQRLESEAEKISWDSLKERIDFAYIAMHGRFAEDGTIQGFFEILGIPYLGSKVLASALSMDKAMQKVILKSHGINVAKSITIKPHELSDEHATQLLTDRLAKSGLLAPYFVKPSHEGSSLGMNLIWDQALLLPAIRHASLIDNQHPQAVLVEEYVKGMEFSCITITDYKSGRLISLPPTEIVIEPHSAFFDYEQKYMPGRATKFTPARCSQEIISNIQETCMKVTQILGFDTISRIDGFVLADTTVIIFDPNTLTGMAPSSYMFRQAAEANMSHTDIINHLIETDLAHYGMLDAVHKREEEEKQLMDKQQKKRIAILLGGRSHEKEISLESGRNVYYKLSPHKYEPLALFVDDKLELYRIDQSLLVSNSTKEITQGLRPSMKIAWNDLPTYADFVFIGLHGGEGENGSIQGTLEMLSLPYNGSSVLTSALCIDKYKTAHFLHSQGFDVPANYLIDKKAWLRDHKAQVTALYKAIGPVQSTNDAQSQTLSLIVKPHDDGCSMLVQKTDNEEELFKAVDTLFAQGKQYALVEECLQGMELTVGIIGNTRPQALPPSHAVSSGDILSIEEKFLPGAGENRTPAPLSKEAGALVQKTIEDAYKALNCKGYARIDCFYQQAEQSSTGSDRLIILEVNTLPGLTPATCIFHQAAEIGLKPMEFIDLIVELGFEEHSRRPTEADTAPGSIAKRIPAQEKS